MSAVPEPATLAELLSLRPEQVDDLDIALTNLLCAEGLPGAEDIDIPKYLGLLDEMAEAARVRTEKSWRLFKLKPQEFAHSENVFRVMMMEHVIRAQFGVHYDPVVAEIVEKRGQWDSSDSSEVFIHGILGQKRTGTCSSLPVVSVAVGRRLGYPLHFVRVPNHGLFHWDDGEEKFNVQHTNAGSEIHDDEFYYEWPQKWDAEMFALNARTKVWLHSMTSQQEISKFLCNRALLLRDAQRFDEALAAIDHAERFDPINPACPDIREHIHYVRMTNRSLAVASAAAYPSQQTDVLLAPRSPYVVPDHEHVAESRWAYSLTDQPLNPSWMIGAEIAPTPPVKKRNITRKVAIEPTDLHSQLSRELTAMTKVDLGSREYAQVTTKIAALVNQINREQAHSYAPRVCPPGSKPQEYRP